MVTAYHEAAHAVAVRLRGGTVHSVTLDPGLTVFTMPQPKRTAPKLFHNGVKVAERPDEPQSRQLTETDGFIAFAGPWAAVRCRWHLPLDGIDEHGNAFATYLDAVLRTNTSDYATYSEAPKRQGVEDDWGSELERHWPIIRIIAQRLLIEHRQQQRWQADRQRWRTRRRHRSQSRR